MRIVFFALFVLLLAACSPAGPPAFSIKEAKAHSTAAWQNQVPQMLARINPPKLASPVFDITIFGAKPDSTFDSRPAIARAIDVCHRAGGGRVLLPPGYWFSKGPLHLQSGVELHLAAGATLAFSDVAEDYLPLVKVRWEGTVCWNYSPLIYAFQQQNIAITGQGAIDGRGADWSRAWRKQQKPDKQRLRQMGNDTLPEQQRVFGNGFLDRDGDGQDDGFGDGKPHFLRPTLIELYECRNILIEEVTLRNSPFWTVHPVFSKNITIRGLQIFGGYLNDDGIDPDSCEDVLIEDCYVSTEDDAISIKAGRDQDAWHRGKSKNIIVRNCRLNSGVNAFCIGSEMSGGVENIFVQDCQILSGKHALNFKCNLDRGGQVQQIFMKNIQVDTIEKALFIFRMDYHGYRGNNFPTRFNDFYAHNIRCKQVKGGAFKVVGVEAEPITRLALWDIEVQNAALESQLAFVEELVVEAVQISGAPFFPQ